MDKLDAASWSENTFGKANLGDKRRTKRLVKLGEDLSKAQATSIVKASGDAASIEGAYRFIRNESISSEEIARSGYGWTDERVNQTELVLAIQDTTGLSYQHCVSDDLGDVSSTNVGKKAKAKSLYVHSTLMVDAKNGQVIGLGNQHYWKREERVVGTKREQRQRAPEEKESYKWQRNMMELSTRLGNLDNVIDVCDREADAFEYLDYQVNHGHRFVVRSKEERLLEGPQKKLSDTLAQLPVQGYYQVKIGQKGGRGAREAQMSVSYTRVTLRKPDLTRGPKTVTLNVVHCQEVNKRNEKEKLRWKLYTTESIASLDDALSIVRYYELRWKIEEFHKIWKSDGTQVEALRMHTSDNIQRVATILAFVAVRLFQLRDAGQCQEESKQQPCTDYLSTTSWKLLWKSIEKSKPFPKKTPSVHWAYYSIAKLGGWYDSKRTGRVGIKAYWSGWIKLYQLVESYELFKGLEL